MFEAIGNPAVRLDEKGRFPLPPSIRNGLKQAGHEHLMVAHWQGRLRVYTPEDWKSIELAWAANPVGGEDVLYGFLTTVEQVKLDKSGRVRLSSNLREWARIDQDANLVSLGAMGVLEIWNSDAWDERFTRARSSLKTGSEIDSIGLPPRLRAKREGDE